MSFRTLFANLIWTVGRSLAQYGRFAEVGQEGFSYFVEHISASAPGPEIHASMPFLVPFFVKVVVGEIYR